jgi:hypothetical protein
MNDQDAQTLASVRAGLSDARYMPGVLMRTPPEEIIGRGKRRRRNRSYLAAVLGAATAVAVMASVVAGSPASRGGTGRQAPAPVLRIHTAAWTVVRDRDGIVSITMRQAQNSGALRRALAQAGVPAVVLYRHVCPYPETGQPQAHAILPGTGHNGTGSWVRIRPSAMPAHTVILIGFEAVSDLVLRLHPKPGQGLTTYLGLVWDSSAAQATPVNGRCLR